MTEEEETPTTEQTWVCVLLGIKEPLGLPPEKLM
jgi:hypothetical protein